MSLSSTWIQAQNGTWYKDPVIRGPHWFICWDDDEPIELVVRRNFPTGVEKILEDLNQQGWKIRLWGKVQSSGSRLFLVDGVRSFFPAVRAFLRQESGPPADLLNADNDPYGLSPGMGVLYYNERG